MAYIAGILHDAAFKVQFMDAVGESLDTRHPIDNHCYLYGLSSAQTIAKIHPEPEIIGVGFGGSIMGTLLVHTSLNLTVLFQTGLVLGVMMFPLLFRERSGEKLLPWTAGKSMIHNHMDAVRSPLSIVKDLLKGFAVFPTFLAAIFTLLHRPILISLEVLNKFSSEINFLEFSSFPFK